MWYRESVVNTVENFSIFPNPDMLVAISKGMQAVKLLQQNFLLLIEVLH